MNFETVLTTVLVKTITRLAQVRVILPDTFNSSRSSREFTSRTSLISRSSTRDQFQKFCLPESFINRTNPFREFPIFYLAKLILASRQKVLGPDRWPKTAISPRLSKSRLGVVALPGFFFRFRELPRRFS